MKLMCQISRLLQRWCFCSRGSQTHWCWVKGKQTWNIKVLWTYLKLIARCIYEAIGWLRNGSNESYLFWTRSDGRFRCSRSGWIGGDNRGFDYVSLFVMHIRQSIWSFSCPSVSFMNGDFVLYWAAGTKDVFSCVLEIKLQSTKVCVYAIKKKF